MRTVNLQVVPAPEGCPAGTTFVQLHARTGQGAEAACRVCGGSGRFKHEQCRKCNGIGYSRYVEAARLDVTRSNRVEVERWLDTISWEGRKKQCTIRLAESGGGLTNTGHATIICGLKGERLVSVGGRASCNAEHAVFFVHAALEVRYYQHRGDGHGSISLVGVDRESRHLLLPFEQELWTFDDASLEAGEIEVTDAGRRSSLTFPFDAVRAVKSKARDYHCRSAYYAADRFANGPSGALTGAGAAFGGMPSPFKGPGIGY